jgi:AAA domain
MSTFGREDDEEWERQRRQPHLVADIINIADRAQRLNGKARANPIKIVPFDKIRLAPDARPYRVKGLIPTEGLTVVWGPPKSGKTFATFDICMHVALGWEYRGRRVTQGSVVYCSFEGQAGIAARMEAYRRGHLVPPLIVTLSYSNTFPMLAVLRTPFVLRCPRDLATLTLPCCRLGNYGRGLCSSATPVSRQTI